MKPQPGQTWAIVAGRLFDGEAFCQGRPVVLVQDGRIRDVDLTGAAPPEGMPVVDVGELTLLPGLIDAHVHLAFDPAKGFETSASLAEEIGVVEDTSLLDRMHRKAQQALRAGVTTVRDLGDPRYAALALRQQYAAGKEAGPEILAAGPPITRTGGHCWYLGGEADTIDEISAAVIRHLEHGVDVIKIMATGGFLTSTWGVQDSQYTRDELAVAVRAAHDGATMLTAHAYSPQAIGDAVAAGADGVEHCSFITRVRTEPEWHITVEPDWNIIDDLAQAGTYIGTTAAERPPASRHPNLVESWERLCGLYALMHQKGAHLVCSSDAGVSPSKTFDVLPEGIVLFGRLGWTNAHALAAATSLAAASCGIGDRKGRIAPGYDADLLAIAGNPATDLNAIRNIHSIFRAGHRIAPDKACDTIQ